MGTNSLWEEHDVVALIREKLHQLLGVALLSPLAEEAGSKVKDGSSAWRQARRGEEWEGEREVETDTEKRENTDGRE
jgi:hypothetical protein